MGKSWARTVAGRRPVRATSARESHSTWWGCELLKQRFHLLSRPRGLQSDGINRVGDNELAGGAQQSAGGLQNACRPRAFSTLRCVPFRGRSPHSGPRGSGPMTDEMRAAESLVRALAPSGHEVPIPEPLAARRESMVGPGRREGTPRVHALHRGAVRAPWAMAPPRVTTSRPAVMTRITCSRAIGEQRVALRREYVPAIAAYARAVLDLGYDPEGSACCSVLRPTASSAIATARCNSRSWRSATVSSPDASRRRSTRATRLVGLRPEMACEVRAGDGRQTAVLVVGRSQHGRAGRARLPGGQQRPPHDLHAGATPYRRPV